MTSTRIVSLCRALLFALSLAPLAAYAQQKVIFYTNWYAEAEHGGFYQAVAEGTYKASGLDVEVRMGGPQINVMQLLLAGQADLVMGYDLQTIKAIEQHLPVVTVAATFQKDPAVLIAHPGVNTLPDLKSKTLLIGQASETTFWPWLKAKYGFTDAQKRPYAFSVQQFLVDQNVAQQGYLTSEPFTIEKAGVKPVVFLLADSGYPPYAETIVVTEQDAEEQERDDSQVRRGHRAGLEELPEAARAGQRADQESQSRDDRRTAGVRREQDARLRPGGRRRCQDAWHPDHDRCAAGSRPSTSWSPPV